MKKLIYCILLASITSNAFANDSLEELDSDLSFIPTNPSGKSNKNINESTVLNVNSDVIQQEDKKINIDNSKTEQSNQVTTQYSDNTLSIKEPEKSSQTKYAPTSPKNTYSSTYSQSSQTGNSKYTYVAKLPISEIYVIQKTPQSAKFYYADAQGRYLIYNGDLYDMWDNKRKLDTRQALEYSFSHIPLDIVKNFQGLNEIISIPKERSLTKGREYYLFIDPTDENSVKMLESIYNDRNFISYYSHIVIMNNTTTALTKEYIKKLSCSDATAREKIEAIINRDTELLEKTQTFCNLSQVEEKLNNNDKLAKHINIHNLPFIIAPSGRYADGALLEPYKFMQGIK